MGHRYWPLFDLEVRTPRLVLRYLDDETGAELLDVALTDGVHDSSWMPFQIPWTDFESPELERNAQQYWWSCRATTSPERIVVGSHPAVRKLVEATYLGRPFIVAANGSSGSGASGVRPATSRSRSDRAATRLMTAVSIATWKSIRADSSS